MKKGSVMSVGFALLLFAQAAGSDKLVAAVNNTSPTEAQVAPSSYDNYTQAYRAAKQAKKPMLVILNPAKGAKVALISLEDVQKTRVRRDLLQNYVVAVIDTSTSHGKKVQALFGSPQLPHVAIIDNEQAFQVYQTSETLYGQMWDTILTSFQNAQPATRMPVQNSCPYCQQFRQQ
jgi:ABC-type amino acid transport substrate-binding protein